MADRGRGRGRGGRGGRGFPSAPRGNQGGGSQGGGFQGGGFQGGRGRGAPRGRGGPQNAQAFQPPDETRPVPDKAVHSHESSLVVAGKAPADQLAKLSLSQDTPFRPGYGTRGDAVVLWANYFQILPRPDLILHRYSIDIVPEVENRRLRARVVQLLLEDSRLSALAPGIASDYQSTLISAKPLDKTISEINIKYRDAGEQASAPDAKQYRARLQSTGTFPVSQLIDYLTSTNVSAAFADKAPVTQALNIILNHAPKSKDPGTLSARRNVHVSLTSSPSDTFDLGAGLQAWRGYFSSIRMATSRLLVNVQIKNISMYKSVRLDELMQDFQRQNGPDPGKMARFIRRVRVDRLHLKRGKKAKSASARTISGLATPQDGRKLPHPPKIASNGASAQQIQFFTGSNATPPLKPNQYVTVSEYFNKVYGVAAKSSLPAVNIGTLDNPNYLPPEVCFVLPAQPSVTLLSSEQTAQMIRFAVRRPFENARSITETGLGDLKLKPVNPVLSAFGLDVSARMLAVNGRILPAPGLQYAKNRTVDPRFGSWNMTSATFSRGATLTAWSILWLQTQAIRDPWGGSPNTLVQTLQEFHRRLGECGLRCPPPLLPGATVNVDSADDKLAIRQGFSKIIGRNRQEKLLLVIMPRQDDGHYSAIKQCGELEFGIHTVCVIATKFAKPNNSQYFANVALKINLKMGGANQTLPAAKIGFIAQGKTMVVGIDVTHPSPGSESSAPSIASMVASTSRDLAQFPAVLYSQKGREEMVADLTTMLKTRLELWRRHNSNQLPENILVYRDGVSEGQYPLVLEKELPLLREGCRQVYPPKAKQPAISIVVVSKRHSTRFYITTTEANKIDERSSNPKHGTVVDRGITEPRFWDFFLQSHTALQGTARPAHYFVVHDEILSRLALPPGYTHAADILEDVTHNLSYMFGRATKAVSYCPAAYYADIACERGRRYLGHLFSPTTSQAGSVVGSASDASQGQLIQIHENLKDTMFYI